MHLASAQAALQRVERTLSDRIQPVDTTLEAASGIFADELYGALGAMVLLARVFVVLRYRDLPETERAYADRVAERTTSPLYSDSPILVLLASRGTLPEWNDRKWSRGHLAIPLTTATSAASSPMVAALLRDLGADTPAGFDPLFLHRTTPIRTFHVFDARTSLDPRGRLTIPERDFVHQYDVRTVLGAGGTVGNLLFAMILFARQHVSRASADPLVPLATEFASLSADAVWAGRVFSGG